MSTLAAILMFIAMTSSTLTPTHVVLTLTASSSSLQVTFSTSSKPSTPSVTFWPTADETKQTEITSTDVIQFTHPASKTVEYITSLTMTPLTQDTDYSYYVSGESKDTTTNSDTFKIHTLPEDNQTISIGIYGDMGAYGTALIEKGEGGLPYYSANHLFDFIMHIGDLAYDLDSNNGETGVEFMENLQIVSASTPYVVAPGNHEFMGYSESYYSNFFFGQQALGKSSESADPLMYFSFDVGSKLHIVVISTEVYCEDKTTMIPQYEWLEKDLAAVRARTVQPWILVFGHRQIYIGSYSTLHSRLMRLGLQCTDSTLQHCYFNESCDTGKYCGYSIENLFTQYKIDAYFAGHVHTYNRMYPISADLSYETQDEAVYVNPQHPVYVITGAAGTESTPTPTLFGAGDPYASPTVVSVGGFSFSLVNVYNSTHLQLIQNNVSTAKTVDTFWIVKDPSKDPWNKTAALTLTPDQQIICDQ